MSHKNLLLLSKSSCNSSLSRVSQLLSGLLGFAIFNQTVAIRHKGSV